MTKCDGEYCKITHSTCLFHLFIIWWVHCIVYNIKSSRTSTCSLSRCGKGSWTACSHARRSGGSRTACSRSSRRGPGLQRCLCCACAQLGQLPVRTLWESSSWWLWLPVLEPHSSCVCRLSQSQNQSHSQTGIHTPPDYVCKQCTGYVEYQAKQGVHIESGPLIGRDEKW